MPPAIATVVCISGIVGLFWLDRDKKARTSVALWIPVAWLSIACSRSVGQWLQVGPTMDSANSTDAVLEGSPFDRLIFTGFLLVGLVVLANRRNRVERFLRANGPVLLFFAYCTVSIVWSDYPLVAFKRWTKAVGDLVMILIVLTDAQPMASFKRFLARPAFVLIPLSILFIKYYPDIGTAYGPWGGPRTLTGVTMNKNNLGAICLLFGLGALWRSLTAYEEPKAKGRMGRLVAHGVILAMVVWLLWTANSVTSSSCLLMASVLMLATKFRAVIRRPAVIHVVIAAMLVVSASIVFLGASPDALKAMGRNPTLTDRTEVWGWLFRLVQNPLLGTGFESFWLGPRLAKLWSIYWWHPNEAHNGYIEIYLNLGWLGIALLAVVIATGYRAISASYRRNMPLANLGLPLFLVGMTYNFTEAAFFKMLHPVWIFFLLAIVSASPVLYRKTQPSGQNSLQHHGILIGETAPSLSEETV